MVYDQDADATGNYGLMLQNVFNSPNTVPLAYETTYDFNIEKSVETDIYTFNGNANDFISLRMNWNGCDLGGQILIYDPLGNLIYNNYAGCNSLRALVTLPQTGIYTVLVYDQDADATGNYGLMLQNVSNSPNAVPLAYETAYDFNIEKSIETDIYTFNGNANDFISLCMNWNNCVFGGQMVIYDPLGNLIYNDYSSGCTPLRALVTLPQTGIYTVLAYDHWAEDTGNYGLMLQNIFNSPNAVPLAYETAYDFNIEKSIETDIYTFNGNANDIISLRMNWNDCFLAGQMVIYDPLGNSIYYDYSQCDSLRALVTLPQTGIYTVLVYDNWAANTGNYELTLTLCTAVAESVPDFSYDRINNTVYFYDNSLHSTDYTWNFGNGVSINNIINPTLTFSKPNVYNVCLTTRNYCSDDGNTVCQQISIPGIASVSPNKTGNNNFYVGYLQGAFAQDPNAQIYLLKDNTTTPVDTVIYESATKLKFNITFADSPTGVYDIVYSTPNFSDTLKNTLTIEYNKPYQFRAIIEGRPRILVNRFFDYKIGIQNLSNQTAFGVPVYVIINGSTEAQLVSAVIDENLPEDLQGMEQHFYKIYEENTADSLLVGIFVIPFIPSNSSSFIELKIKSSEISNLKLQTYIGDPLFSGEQINENLQMRTSCNNIPPCINAALDVVGLVPGVGCAIGAMSLGCSISDIVNGNNSPATNVFNLIFDVVGIANCLSPFSPTDEVAKTIAKQLLKAAGVLSTVGSTISDISDCVPDPQPPRKIQVATSMDPNDKIGIIGTDNLNYIKGDVAIPYTIYFENVDSASASASEVLITDVIDTTVLDINSVKFTDFGFGGNISSFGEFIGETTFSQDVDLRPEINTIVRVRAWVNTNEGTVSWKFTSFDPATMDLTQDIDAGFLPPNVNKPEGEGFVHFTISPKFTLSTPETIQNSASIVFDSNAPIITPVFTNTIDKINPSSSIEYLSAETNDTAFVVNWNGSDAHSGIDYYTIYVSEDNEVFTLWQSNLKTNYSLFTGKVGHSYSFYVIATDKAGNTETKNPIAEASTSIVGLSEINKSVNYPFKIVPNPTQGEVYIYASDAMQEMNISCIEIFDSMGKSSFRQNNPVCNNGTCYLNLSHINSGLYTIVVISKKSMFSQKLLIK
ncbi:MAG: T9SS type A sorting domain-containing protein [Sphingobacteriales bacterium]|nr:T9SS type A sorting domain-containing protein [Sphingobacteriales bacterium]